MPLYEYKCNDCDYQFEELVSYSKSNEMTCPNCGSEETQKLVSAFATIGSSASGGSSNSCSYSGSGFS